jgi:HEAT repeat protein
VSPTAPVLLSSLLALVVTPADRGRVEVRDGAAVLAAFSPRTPAARRGTASAREVTVAGHPLIEVRIPAGGGHQEVWLGERRRTGAAAIWTAILGPLDEDAETARELALGPDGVDLYRTATRIGRCDGAPGRLFPQRWDFERRRFVPAPPPVPPPAAQTIQARGRDPKMPAGRAAGGFYWTASSSAAGVKDVRGLGPPVALNDGDPGTTWLAGAGDARGEFLTAHTAADGVAVVGLRLVPAAGRPPRKLALVLGAADDHRFDVELPEGAKAGEPLWVPLPRPVLSSCVTVVIREAAPGTGPVGIADLEVITDIDGADGIARLVRATRAGGACEGRVPLLAQAGAAAVEPVARAIAEGPAEGRECLLDALARLMDADGTAGRQPAVAGALVAALDHANDSEEKLVLAALPHLSEPPVAALGRLLADQRRAEEERMRAARALAALCDGKAPAAADGARAALLAVVGGDPPALRLAVRERLAAAHPPLAAAVRAALVATPRTASARRADLMLIAGAAAAREPAEQEPTLVMLRAATGDGEDFAAQGRAIEALGRLGGEAALAQLARLRAESPDPVVRYLAARELAGQASLSALPALRLALGDGDPRVRETAALALAQRGDKSEAAALVAAARHEPWPFVRRAQVTALGALCAPGTADVLVRADERDLPEVRRAALEGLARCRDARAPGLLLARLGRRAEDPEMRAVAARLLGGMGDRSMAPRLAEILARLRTESQADVALEGVALVTLKALAQLGGPDAVSGARGLLQDERPTLRRAAVEVLGTLCDGGPGARALETAAHDRDPTVAAAALAARRRCPK